MISNRFYEEVMRINLTFTLNPVRTYTISYCKLKEAFFGSGNTTTDEHLFAS